MGGKMKKLLILLFICPLLIKGQFLQILQEDNKPELFLNNYLTWDSTATYQSDFSATESISETGGTGSANNDNISDGTTSYSNTYKFYADGSTGSHRGQITLGQTSGAISRLYIYHYLPNANTNVDGITTSNSMSTSNVISGSTTNTTGYKGTWNRFNLLVAFDNTNATRINQASSANLTFTGANSSSDDIMYIYNIQLWRHNMPSGFTTGTLTKTNYVDGVHGGGLKFVEATGESKVTMTDTLEAGYYTFKVNQDWTQGKLWFYNGTTTYNMPQSDGYYAVKVYADGTHPIIIGCDNNTISSILYLSIK